MNAEQLALEAQRAIDTLIFLTIVVGGIPFLAVLLGALIKFVTIITNQRS